MKRLLAVPLSFFRRDAARRLSYRFDFAMDLIGVFFTAATFFFVSQFFGAAASGRLQDYGGNYFAFVLIGISFSAFQNAGLSAFPQSLREEQLTGTLEPLLTLPLRLWQWVTGVTLWELAHALGETASYLLFGFVLFGLSMPLARLGPALLILFFSTAAFLGLGLLAGAFVMVIKRGNPVLWVLVAAGDLLGGVFFPVALLPTPLKIISCAFPITHSLEGLRKSLLMGAGYSDLLPQFLALSLMSLLFWTAGFWAFGRALALARRRGTLGHY